jgi:hypothetical protein
MRLGAAAEHPPEREVPRHDREYGPERQVSDELLLASDSIFVPEEGRGVFGVELATQGAFLHFGAASWRSAISRDYSRIMPLFRQFGGRAAEQSRALGNEAACQPAVVAAASASAALFAVHSIYRRFSTARRW